MFTDTFRSPYWNIQQVVSCKLLKLHHKLPKIWKDSIYKLKWTFLWNRLTKTFMSKNIQRIVKQEKLRCNANRKTNVFVIECIFGSLWRNLDEIRCCNPHEYSTAAKYMIGCDGYTQIDLKTLVKKFIFKSSFYFFSYILFIFNNFFDFRSLKMWFDCHDSSHASGVVSFESGALDEMRISACLKAAGVQLHQSSIRKSFEKTDLFCITI